MPVKPQPVRYRCSKCGWGKVFAPASDALVETPPSECEKFCSESCLESKKLSGKCPSSSWLASTNSDPKRHAKYDPTVDLSALIRSMKRSDVLMSTDIGITAT